MRNVKPTSYSPANLVDVPTVMEGSIDGRATGEHFLQSQDVPDPPGHLGQGEEPVIIHVQSSPQSSPPAEVSLGPSIGQVLVDSLPVYLLP